MDALLSRHRLTWDDVITPAGRLSKLCGRLGSSFDGERGAAYDHALRFILSGHATWSRYIHLPGPIAAAPADPAQDPPAETPPAPVVSAPDDDWLTTVQRLRQRKAWRSASEHALLNELEQELAAGQTLSATDARRVRDIWWYAELQTANPEEAWLWPG